MAKREYNVYLFRHGQTYYNKNGYFTGWKDSRLTPKGFNDAKKIAKKLKGKKFEVAFFTRLSRSKDTLKEVLRFHPECRILIEDNRMIERSYGSLSGTSHKQFIEKFGQKKFDLVHRNFFTRPPKGESFSDVEKRVKNFVNSLKVFIRKNQCNVAISAHGNSIRLFRKVMENAKVSETVEWKIPYDSYYEYTISV